MRIVVTGFRGWLNAAVIDYDLDHWNWISGHRLEVAVGDCPDGADEAVRQWILTNRRQDSCAVFCAGDPNLVGEFRTAKASDWDLDGKIAGPKRNKAMVDSWRPLVVLAYLHPDSKGTVHCASYARQQGIQVIERWEGRQDGRTV